MSNSIWNKYDIKDMPDENKLVVLVDKHDGFYNACFVDKIDWANDWYNYIEKWCYLDELLAQADKAERLQKAVDYALQVLDDVIEIGGIDLAIMKIKQMIKETQ